MNLRAVGAPRKFRCTTKAASDAVVSPDLIGRVFEAEEPNQKWGSDITYIPVGDNYAYLAVVMDLFSRKIVSRSLRATMTTELILGAVRKAQANHSTHLSLRSRITIHQ
jgi:transposase InsO family protein